MTIATKNVDTTVSKLEAIANIGWAVSGNYRAHVASHKPRKGEEIDKDRAAIYRTMLEAAEAGEQPWSAHEAIYAMSWQNAVKLGYMTAESWAAIVSAIEADDKDPRQGLYSVDKTPGIVGITGHCRSLTACDVGRDGGFPLAEIRVPVIVREYKSLRQVYRDQCRENESIGVGVSRTTPLDRFSAGERAVSFGCPLERPALKREIGAKDGVCQEVLAQLLVARIIGNDGFYLSKPKKDAAYNGYIPANGWRNGAGSLTSEATAIARPVLRLEEAVAKAKGAEAEEARAKYERAKKRAGTKLRKLCKEFALGQREKVQGVLPKTAWFAAFGDETKYPRNSIGGMFFGAHYRAEGFDALSVVVGAELLGTNAARIVEALQTDQAQAILNG